MKTACLLFIFWLSAFGYILQAGAAGNGADKSAEALFREHCAACHPAGGNIINPVKTLHKKDLEANGIKSPKDIVGKMRNPGESMTQFDNTMVSEKDAEKIAVYILKTFR